MGDFDDDDVDDVGEWNDSKVNLAAFVLPLVTALIALGVGGLFGTIITRVLTPEPVPIEVARDLTAAELAEVCKPLVADALAKLDAADEKVKGLEDQVSDKQNRVKSLEAEMKKRGQRGKAIMKELKAARVELTQLREELAVAVEEKAELTAELKVTVEKLEETEETLKVTKNKLEVAKKDVLKNRWIGFVQDGMLQICEKGNRKKMGKCRETVTAAFTPEMGDKFRHCIKSGQAVPSVIEVEKKQQGLPAYSEWLGQSNRVTKGWYVMFCDPTLPEAADLTEVLKTIDSKKAGAFNLDGLDDLDIEDSAKPKKSDKNNEPEDDLDSLDDFDLDF